MFVRMSLLSAFVVAIGLCAHVLSAADGAKPSPTEKQRQEEIRKLIGQLSSEHFKDREEATRRLIEREDALPALREAVKSEDAEIRARAQKALETITKRLAKRALRRAIGKLKKGQTDQFVDTVVQWRDYVDEECWKAALDHFHTVNDKAMKASGGQFKLTRNPRRLMTTLPWVEITKLRFSHTDHLKKGERANINRERIIADSITVPDGFIHNSFVICSGSVRQKYSLGSSIVLSNGNLHVGDKERFGGIGGCVVICDGDVTADGVGDSVIICTGKVSIGEGARNSVIVSGSEVRMRLNPDFPGAIIENSLIQERQLRPLDFIRFFDPAKEGIEAKTAGNAVHVEGIAAAKAFGRAGVRCGDQLVAVNGTKVDSAEAFRRLLRRYMQAADPLILDLRREGKPLRIEVRGAGDAP